MDQRQKASSISSARISTAYALLAMMFAPLYSPQLLAAPITFLDAVELAGRHKTNVAIASFHCL
jgi:hypothetical protein